MKRKIAFTILRVTLGAVFLLFGIGKFRNDVWAEAIRHMELFIRLPWDVNISVALIGLSEVITGLFLILGLFARFFAGLASIQLIAILILLNFEESRDIGLLGAAIYMALIEENSFGIDNIRKKNRI